MTFSIVSINGKIVFLVVRGKWKTSKLSVFSTRIFLHTGPQMTYHVIFSEESSTACWIGLLILFPFTRTSIVRIFPSLPGMVCMIRPNGQHWRFVFSFNRRIMSPACKGEEAALVHLALVIKDGMYNFFQAIQKAFFKWCKNFSLFVGSNPRSSSYTWWRFLPFNNKLGVMILNSSSSMMVTLALMTRVPLLPSSVLRNPPE